MANKNTKRTDPHRKGAIVPGNYSYITSYYLGGPSCPAIGFDTVVKLKENGAVFFSGPTGGGAGKCAVCGAWFMEGDVWYHEPTQEHIHLGHDCADKYGLMVDRSALELEMQRAKEAAAVQIQRRINEETRAKFLAENPGLAEDFEDGKSHYIVADIYNKFVQWCSISPKQIALVHKLAEEIRHPAPAKAEKPKAEPPSGKADVEGTVLGTKYSESLYGETLKMLVVFTTPAGEEWKAYGTVPSSIMGSEGGIKGKMVAFRATFERKELGFAFFSRPTQAKIVK
jgi:hypothetical protein